MSDPEPNDPKRDCSLPAGCKDLIDVIRLQPEPVPVSLPPITRRVTLPEIVSVRYLAELLSMSLDEIYRLSGYPAPRSLSFDQAQRILRNYGIWADRAA